MKCLSPFKTERSFVLRLLKKNTAFKLTKLMVLLSSGRVRKHYVLALNSCFAYSPLTQLEMSQGLITNTYCNRHDWKLS